MTFFLGKGEYIYSYFAQLLNVTRGIIRCQGGAIYKLVLDFFLTYDGTILAIVKVGIVTFQM